MPNIHSLARAGEHLNVTKLLDGASQDNIRDNRASMVQARRQSRVRHAVRVYEGNSNRRPVGRPRAMAKKRSAQDDGLELLLGLVIGVVALLYLFAK